MNHTTPMFHDVITGRQRDRNTEPLCEDRRTGPRVPYPAELVIAWHCDMPSTTRYPVVDLGDGGFRIHSSLPLMKGMTGTAVSLLPEGQPIGEPVMVAWCKPNNTNGGYDVGLRRF